MNEVGGSDDRVELRSWDPPISAARRTMEHELLGKVDHLPAQRARWKRRAWVVWLQVSSHPIDAAFWAMAASCVAGGLLVASLGWPLWGRAGQESYDAIVLGSASAAAFGSIVFSVVGVSLTQSVQFGAGYSNVVLSRPGPWLSGFGLVALSAALFVLAAFDPTRSGAMSAALLVSGGIAAAWVLARQVMEDADPLSAAQRAGKHYRKMARTMRKHAATNTRMHMPKVVRGEKEIESALVRRAERDFVVAPLRMLRQGVVSSCEQADLTAAVVLFGASLATFLEYASEKDGEVGGHDGLIAVVLETSDRITESALKHKNNEAANYAIAELTRIAMPALKHADYAAVRSLVQTRLSAYVDQAWTDDHSTIPASSVVAMGNLAATWVNLMAWQDAVHALEALGQMAVRATVEGRRHIGMPASSQLARLLPILANEPQEPLRRHYLKEWTRCVVPVAALAPAEAIGLVTNTEPLVPGISLHTPDTLQTHLWQAPDAGGAAGAVLDVMKTCLPAYAGASNPPNHVLQNGLALTYCATLVAAGNRDRLEQPTKVAERVVESAFGWMEKADSSVVQRQLQDSEIAELCWSLLLTTAFLIADPTETASIASTLLGKVGLDGDEWALPPINGGYLKAFYQGLQILAQWPDEARRGFEERWDRLQDQEGFGSWDVDDWGLHIDGLGTAPSLNVNNVTAPSAIIAAINGWAIESWPSLRGADAPDS